MIIDSGVITGSLVVSGSYSQTGSAVIDGNLTVLGTINATISGSATSASYAATASVAPAYLPLAGGTVSGNLIVAGTASIAYLNVVFESASVIYSSGSNIFGDAVNDTQTLYGTVIIPTGSLIVSGTTAIDGDLTVSPDGYEVFHVHPSGVDVTGSLTVDSDLRINANMYMLADKLIYGTASYASSSVVAPYYTLTSSFNTTSASLSTRVTDLESFSSSLDVTFATDAQLNAATASLSASLAIPIAQLAATASTLTSASASFVVASGSNSTRVTNLETTSSNLTSASASFSIRVSNTETTASNLVVASGSLSTRVTNLEATSSTFPAVSASFVTVSASFSSTSGSLSTRTTDLENTASFLTSASASFASQLNSISAVTGSYATTGSNTFVRSQYISDVSNAISFVSTASLYTDGGLRVSKDAFISGGLSIAGNFTVFGTASINYVTSSTFIGLEFIDLNTDLPALRYAGINVGDSGSAAGISSSFWYDSENNDWIFVHTPAGSGQVTSSLAIFGPVNYNSTGNEVGIAGNYLTKGQVIPGDTDHDHHITSSQIYDDGTTVSIPGNLTVTGSLSTNSTTTVPFNVGLTSTYYGTIASTIVGSNNVFTLDTGSYTAAKFIYTVAKDTSARMGEILAVWNAGTTTFTDMSTTDIGSTTAVTASVSIISSQAQLNFQTNTSGWTIKSQGTLI